MYVGKAKNPRKICGQYQGPAAANEKVEIYCTRSSVGKYVHIVKRSTRGRRFLSLSEVSICGKKGGNMLLIELVHDIFVCLFV